MSKCAAVITTYKPDVGFIDRVVAISKQVSIVIVVDNTPGCHNFPILSGVLFLQGGVNKGLGHAINIGLNKARDELCTHVALFDQDSTPDSFYIGTMLQELQKLQRKYGNKTLIGPTHLDDQLLVPPKQDKGIQTVTCLPTSGLIFPLLPNDLLEFSTDLFLDFADFEWCWRLRQFGWTIIRISSCTMLHRLGIAQRNFLGIKYHVPAPYRHYFQFRDTLFLVSEPHVPLYSKFRLFIILIPKIIVYPFILDHGYTRFRWMLCGIKDYINGVRGIGTASRILS